MEALPPVALQKSSQKNLALGIGISVGLHLAISALLLGTPQGPPVKGSVSFLDLKNVQFPTETATPAPVTPPRSVPPTPEPAPAKETPAAEKVPPAPDAATSQQQPAEQAAPAPAAQPSAQEQIANTTLGLGMSKGYFSSIGNGDSLRDGVRGYYLDMLQQINQRWWVDQGVQKNRPREIIVSLLVAHSGEIVRATLLTSSGNAAYDKAVLAALTAAGPFPPLPVDYNQPYFMAPIRLVPPLNLMAS